MLAEFYALGSFKYSYLLIVPSDSTYAAAGALRELQMAAALDAHHADLVHWERVSGNVMTGSRGLMVRF